MSSDVYLYHAYGFVSIATDSAHTYLTIEEAEDLLANLIDCVGIDEPRWPHREWFTATPGTDWPVIVHVHAYAANRTHRKMLTIDVMNKHSLINDPQGVFIGDEEVGFVLDELFVAVTDAVKYRADSGLGELENTLEDEWEAADHG